jgi:hypothetical protein
MKKNYLNEKELSKMNRIVTMFIDYAEMQSEDEIVMSMQDWVDETIGSLKTIVEKFYMEQGKSVMKMQ